MAANDKEVLMKADPWQDADQTPAADRWSYLFKWNRYCRFKRRTVKGNAQGSPDYFPGSFGLPQSKKNHQADFDGAF